MALARIQGLGFRVWVGLEFKPLGSRIQALGDHQSIRLDSDEGDFEDSRKAMAEDSHIQQSLRAIFRDAEEVLSREGLGFWV